MSHLTLETLARIADGPETDDEAAHLAACPDCRTELDALRAQIAALGALTPPAAPESVWRGVEARLRDEREPATIPLPRRSRRAAWLPRAAAAAVVFLAGTLVGARVGGAPPEVAAPDSAATTEVAATAAADPVEALRDAESLYAAALARYMAERGPSDPELDPVRRLAALESIILTAREALAESPDDAVIGGYYRTAVAQREAIMSQVQLTESEVWY
jgi:anti-sigma factor RsiW